ncbi:aldehyde dehydrogenase (NADP(+)), partial [Pseudomonas sp. MAFF 311095]|nr:aldehyde dehydrogenase (NADP(+)) [Pseudomonas petroselini]
MTLTGKMLIGQHATGGNREPIRAINPATDTALEPATWARRRTGRARHAPWRGAAFDGYRETSLEAWRATLLEANRPR